MEKLRNRIKELVEYTERTHRYSSSKIYELYNEAYNKKEQQSTCASCLLTRVRLLKKWMQEHPEKELNEVEDAVAKTELVEPIEEETVDTEPKPIDTEKKSKRKKVMN